MEELIRICLCSKVVLNLALQDTDLIPLLCVPIILHMLVEYSSFHLMAPFLEVLCKHSLFWITPGFSSRLSLPWYCSYTICFSLSSLKPFICISFSTPNINICVFVTGIQISKYSASSSLLLVSRHLSKGFSANNVRFNSPYYYDASAFRLLLCNVTDSFAFKKKKARAKQRNQA